MFDYALAGCQNGTIARLMCISLTTLIRRYGSLLSEKRAERKFNLRSNQTKLAKTFPAMAIFLGKNELSQVDKQIIVDEPKQRELDEAQKAACKNIAATLLHIRPPEAG